jgi:hypothetical protein
LIVDRGMPTKANVEALAARGGIGWVTPLKALRLRTKANDVQGRALELIDVDPDRRSQ